MNTRECMIIIKNEIKTSEVKACQYDRNASKWNVTFQNGKTYQYAFENVEKLTSPSGLNQTDYRISYEERELYAISTIYEFKGKREIYWHICFENGKEKDYRKRSLKIVESCLRKGNSEDVFDYLKQIAKLNDIKNKITGEKITRKKI